MDAILIGVLGFGETWIKPIKENNIKIVAIVDVNKEARKIGKERFQLEENQVYDGSDYEWSKINADLVIECTPPDTKDIRIKVALVAGMHVIVSKPPTFSYEVLEELEQIAEKYKKKIFIVTQKRYLPAFQLVKKMIDSGKLGEFVYGNINLLVDGTFWPTGKGWRKRMPYPSLLDGSVHHYDLIQWWTGLGIEEVVATSWNPSWSPFDNDSDFHVNMKLSNGAMITYNSRWSYKYGNIEHYFSGVHLEFENGILEVIDGKVYYNNEYIKTEKDGEEMMDLELLNIQYLRDTLQSINEDKNQFYIMIQDHKEPFVGVLMTMAAIINERMVRKKEIILYRKEMKIDKQSIDTMMKDVFLLSDYE